MSADRSERALLRHVVATLAYRGGKAIRGLPAGVESFRPAPGSRSPLEILAHVNDLFDWARHLFAGEHFWNDSIPTDWAGESHRFHAALADLDRRLASGEPLGFPAGRVFQGPFADALTHIGQIAYLRRLAGAPVRGENYFRAEIRAGVTGPDQPAPAREFD
jgi:hypothetical protein